MRVFVQKGLGFESLGEWSKYTSEELVTYTIGKTIPGKADGEQILLDIDVNILTFNQNSYDAATALMNTAIVSVQIDWSITEW